MTASGMARSPSFLTDGKGVQAVRVTIQRAPSLRPYYRDQVRRVAVYSALNLRLHGRLPGDAATIGACGAAVHRGIRYTGTRLLLSLARADS